MRISDWSSDVCSSDLDFVLLRSDGTPTYMLSVVVDDHDMGITHVIRGDDHLNNAFRQLALIRAMGWPEPVYAHVRSEEHTSELQSLMRISYAVFCLKKKNRRPATQSNGRVHRRKRNLNTTAHGSNHMNITN